MSLKISLIMNIYNYIFCKMFKSINNTNKIYPEIFTCMYFSILLSVNIYTFLIFSGLKIIKLTVISVFILTLIILYFNYLHFLKRDKYKIIVNKFEETDKIWIIEKLVFLYPQITFCLLFVSLNIDFWRIILLLLAVSITEIISFFKKNKSNFF